ncbi:hypothetical protein MHK_001321 [Candidatus Magnetomorum sp. HK-1]|nr:hypothetical protein MHK_001321 [Candidatus Magnetomorum sp. HK-1]
MKFRSILIILIIGSLSFFFLDIQQVITFVYQYLTKVDDTEPEKETSPIIQGKPCITIGGTAYYYPNEQNSGYVIVSIQRVTEQPAQALIMIEKIRTDKAFKYQNVKYYPDEKLWLPLDRLSCKSP